MFPVSELEAARGGKGSWNSPHNNVTRPIIANRSEMAELPNC